MIDEDNKGLCVITGGVGLLGSRLATKLIGEGYPVRVLDNFVGGHMDNLAPVRGWVETQVGDICRRDDVLKALNDADTVFHFAAQSDPERAWRQPGEVNNTNVNGTLQVLAACRDNNVRRLILGSCTSIYGKGEKIPRNEKFPLRPSSPLAISKLAAEHYCLIWGEQHEFDVICLRFSEIYGSCHVAFNDSRVLLRLVRSAANGKQPILPGDGNQVRDFVYVDDAADAALAALNADIVDKIINVGHGKPYTYEQVVKELSALLDKTLTPANAETNMWEADYNVADISLAKGVLGYEPTVDLREGLKLMIDSMAKVGAKA